MQSSGCWKDVVRFDASTVQTVMTHAEALAELAANVQQRIALRLLDDGDTVTQHWTYARGWHRPDRQAPVASRVRIVEGEQQKCCNNCGTWKPATPQHFYQDSRAVRLPRLRSPCKACLSRADGVREGGRKSTAQAGA